MLRQGHQRLQHWFSRSVLCLLAAFQLSFELSQKRIQENTEVTDNSSREAFCISGQALTMTFNETPHGRQLILKSRYSIMCLAFLTIIHSRYYFKSSTFFYRNLPYVAIPPSRCYVPQVALYDPWFPRRHASSHS